MKKMAFCLSLFCACGVISMYADEGKKSIEITVPVLDRAKFDSNPYIQLKKSIEMKEGRSGVLTITDRDGTPYARVMDIGKITPEGIVFFTNVDSGKLKSMNENQKATFVFFSRSVLPFSLEPI